jgi:DNA ligase (NAD+)
MRRISDLADRLEAASAAYYNGTPTMSDADFDALENELRKLDPHNPVFAKIGAPVDSGWTKVRHPIPMGSLEKAQTEGEFLGWAQNKPNALFLSEKLDGISILLTYLEGKLVRAVTRGDGTEGEDITRNVRVMQGVPAEIPYVDEVHIRGEIVCTKADFAKFFQGESNPRNTASGTSKRQSGWQKCRHLTVLVYNVVFPDGSVKLTYREGEFYWLQGQGFQTPVGQVVSPLSAVQVYKHYIATLREKAPYDIDGLVIEVDGTQARAALGATPNGMNPKGAVALKFPHDQKRTILRDIVWQVGNSGRVTPVAIFDEVELAGARVKQASLHNVARLNKLKLYKGCEVLVSRRNDVIPFVEQNLSLGISYDS